MEAIRSISLAITVTFARLRSAVGIPSQLPRASGLRSSSKSLAVRLKELHQAFRSSGPAAARAAFGSRSPMAVSEIARASSSSMAVASARIPLSLIRMGSAAVTNCAEFPWNSVSGITVPVTRSTIRSAARASLSRLRSRDFNRSISSAARSAARATARDSSAWASSASLVISIATRAARAARPLQASMAGSCPSAADTADADSARLFAARDTARTCSASQRSISPGPRVMTRHRAGAPPREHRCCGAPWPRNSHR